jgi:hypothetical protein
MTTYYYQKAKTTDRYLPDLWVCCGAAHTERGKIDLYVKLLAEYDTRETRVGGHKGALCCKEGYEVVIVADFYGNSSDLSGATIIEHHNA